jgi:molecular chaperone DnaJ
MTQSIADPYAVLGIARDASEQQVRHAYRRLAMRNHPDLHPDLATTERMWRINQAWHVLSSPIRRARYDAEHPRFGISGSSRWSSTPRSPGPTAARSTWEWPSPATDDDYTRRSGSSGRSANPARPGVGRPASIQRPLPGQAWSVGVGLVIVIWLAIVAILFGFLPLPLLGVALLFAARRFAGD